jgi:hypothetical protein
MRRSPLMPIVHLRNASDLQYAPKIGCAECRTSGLCYFGSTQFQYVVPGCLAGGSRHCGVRAKIAACCWDCCAFGQSKTTLSQNNGCCLLLHCCSYQSKRSSRDPQLPSFDNNRQPAQRSADAIRSSQQHPSTTTAARRTDSVYNE